MKITMNLQKLRRNMRLSKLFKNAIKFCLSIQIGYGATYLAYVSTLTNTSSTAYAASQVTTDEDSQLLNQLPQQIKQPLETLTNEIENSTERTLPNQISNAFFLAGQTRTVKGETTDLSRFNLELNPVTVNDFDKEIKIVINRYDKTLTFVKSKTNDIGQEVIEATHTIPGLDIVTFAREKEILQMVDSSGKIYAIDLAFARSRFVLFNTPIPVFTVATIPDAAKSEIKNLKSAFITRGLTPPTKVNSGALIPITEKDLFEKNPKNNNLSIRLNGQWKASPFILYTEKNGERELYGIYHRNVTLEQCKLGFAILNILAYAINPDGQSHDAIQLQSDDRLASAARMIENSMDAKTREAFLALTPDVVNQMKFRMSLIPKSIQSPTDEFLFKEWQAAAVELNQRANQEHRAIETKKASVNGDLSKHWRELEKNPVAEDPSKNKLFNRLVTKKNLKILAAITAGYTAVIGAHLYGGAIVDGNGPAWAVHFANSIYSMFPEVLKDSAYRVTMFKGMHLLSSLLLVNIGVGYFTGAPRNWNFKKSLASIGIKISAAIQFNFLERFAQVIRQPTLFTSLRAGVNPFAKILPDSPTGQITKLDKPIRPGLNNPFLSSAKLKAKSELNKSVLEAKSRVNNRKKVMAALLADLVVAEQFGIDPVTLILEQENSAQGVLSLLNNHSLNEVQRLKANEAFFKKWTSMSHQLFFALGSFSEFKDEIPQIPTKTIIEFYKLAKEKASTLSLMSKNDSNVQKILFQTKLKWHEVSEGGQYKAVGNFGHNQYQFLKNVEPTKFVSDQAWSQFWIDFLPTVIQIPLIGDRANMMKPHELAHSEHNFMYTTPGHFSDMGNQYAIYSIQVPANLAQVYGDKAVEVFEDQYLPVEGITYESLTHSENFIEGIWGWMKGASNLKEAGYGYLAIKSFTKRIKAIQSRFIMDFSTRVFIAGQTVANALPAFGYLTLMGYWLYAWIWDPAVKGNQLYEESIDELNNEFMKVKTQISKGLRFDNEEMWTEGTSSLNGLYEKHGLYTKDLKTIYALFAEYKKIPAEDRASAELLLSQNLGAVVRLKQALVSGNKQDQVSAMANLEKYYDGDQLPAELKNDAQALLDFSIAHPPFKNGINQNVTTAINYLAGAVTTFLGTNMFVDLLRSHNWTEKIVEGALISLPLYFALYKTQKGIDNLSKTLSYMNLQKELPPEAFEMANANHPKFQSLEEYIAWIKKDPASSELIRTTDVAKLAAIFRQDMSPAAEKKFLKKINSNQKPTIGEIVSCSQLFRSSNTMAPTGSDTNIIQMSRSEKLKALIKGMLSPPVK